MKKQRDHQTQNHPFSFSIQSLGIMLLCMIGCSVDEASEKLTPTEQNPDINGDDVINILVLGSNQSIADGVAFSPDQIAEELQNILLEDGSIDIDVNVVAQDIHQSALVTVGLGQAGTEYTYTHHSHSLTQYYYWPEDRDERLANLRSAGDFVWDHVVIAADPYIVSNWPGYYSLGVNKIASTVVEGNAQPLLVMMWPKDQAAGSSIDHFEEFSYRTADGAKVSLSTVPAGLAWSAVPDDKKDDAAAHPTPNGAYLTAASIYSQISRKNASSSGYSYDDMLADIAFATVLEAEDETHYTGDRMFVSPFTGCDIDDEIVTYNHTGSSSENGILGGLNWIFDQVPETLQNGGDAPIHFNYGRANSNFEANKRYQINPSMFDFSLGFPMQDHGNNGDVSMLYGLDRRDSGTMNDTDLGVARFMVEQAELPYARAIPIRTLFAQLREAIPEQSAYRDAWHMHRDLDKAVGAYMYSMLTGKCALGVEPTDQDSDEWRTWVSHKIGYETAWNLMFLQGVAPRCD